MLMFLSDVKINKETKCIAETEYENPIGTTHTTNESAIKYLHEKLKKDNEQIDKIFLFATNKLKGLITTDENIAEEAHSFCPLPKDPRCTSRPQRQNDSFRSPHVFLR